MAGRVHAQKYRKSRAARLHRGGKLARLPRLDPAVVLASGEQDRGIAAALYDVMVRRIGVERLELRRVLHRAEFGGVELTVGADLDAQHVVDADPRDHRAKQLGM